MLAKIPFFNAGYRPVYSDLPTLITHGFYPFQIDIPSCIVDIVFNLILFAHPAPPSPPLFILITQSATPLQP